MKQYLEDSHVPITFLILLVILFALFGCSTPSITIYQQGTCLGNKAEIRETLNLNERVSYYPCKCDSGSKVIIKQIRK